MSRGQYIWGAGLGLVGAMMVAFMVQAIAPSVAKVPGLLICGGGELELVMRRRTSYGVCAGDPDHVHYGVILLVSTLVWSVVCIPAAILFVRRIARRSR